VSLDEWNNVLIFGEMRRAKFIPNMGYVVNRLRFEDGNDEGREKCEGGNC